MKMKRKLRLFDLHWEDILLGKIMPYLSVEDCFNLRSASKICYDLANSYILKLKILKVLNKRPSMPTLNVITLNCKQLNIINFCKTLTITDDILQIILSLNPSLHTLNLNHCSTLTAKCLQPVIISKNSNLTTLKLAYCHWMTDGALDALSLHQSNLENVDLSFCYGITEKSIEVFIKKFHKLQIFNLEGNRQVTDNILMLLATYSKKLRLLNVGRCDQITDNGIRALATSCVYLEGIMTRGCPKVTANYQFFRLQHIVQSKVGLHLIVQ